MDEAKLTRSMSRKANYWDNAPQESLFGHMKDEIDLKHCRSFEEVVTGIDDYMDYYNNRRIKLKLNGLTPAHHRSQAISAA